MILGTWLKGRYNGNVAGPLLCEFTQNMYTQGRCKSQGRLGWGCWFELRSGALQLDFILWFFRRLIHHRRRRMCTQYHRWTCMTIHHPWCTRHMHRQWVSYALILCQSRQPQRGVSHFVDMIQHGSLYDSILHAHTLVLKLRCWPRYANRAGCYASSSSGTWSRSPWPVHSRACKKLHSILPEANQWEGVWVDHHFVVCSVWTGVLSYTHIEWSGDTYHLWKRVQQAIWSLLHRVPVAGGG